MESEMVGKMVELMAVLRVYWKGSLLAVAMVVMLVKMAWKTVDTMVVAMVDVTENAMDRSVVDLLVHGWVAE